jgi:hypothetical protein
MTPSPSRSSSTSDQGAVGELMERLLQEPRVESTVLDDEPADDG